MPFSFDQELLAVDKGRALGFFLDGLQEVAGEKPQSEKEYVASVLAHFSLTPRRECIDKIAPWDVPADLRETVENFPVLNADDSKLLEINGARLLVFGGFFREGQEKRFDIEWCDKQGSMFYKKASHLAVLKPRKEFLGRMGESFKEWALLCSDLNRYFRNLQEEHFLLRIGGRVV